MSGLYLYAILRPGPLAATGGVAGEPIVPLAVGEGEGLVAAVGELDAAPPPTAASLRAHDAAVRRLARETTALLPARFGQWVASRAELAEAVRWRRDQLLAALALVEGCEQMTLRLFGSAAPAPAPAGEGLPAGPGARYLEARRRERAWTRELPELEPVRAALGALVRGELLERGSRPPLVGAAYHLVRRGEAPRYLRAVDAAALPPSLRVLASGPWPPYAFAPGLLP